MNWKEFFKPTLKKIILTLVLFILFVPFIYYDTGIRCITYPCPSQAVGSIIGWLLSSYNFDIYSISFTNLILGLILSYLVSSTLIYIYNKTRRK